MAVDITTRIIEDFWQVNYNININSNIRSHRIKHLLSDTFHLFSLHIPT